MHILLLDIRAGFRENRLKYALLCLCLLLLSMGFLTRYNTASVIVDNMAVPLSSHQSFSATDVMLSFYRGSLPNDLATDPLSFPIDWLVLQVLVAAIVSRYPVAGGYYHEQIALRVGSRTKVGLSRIIGVIVAVFASYALSLLAATLTALLFGNFGSYLASPVVLTLYGVDGSSLGLSQTALLLCLPLAGLTALSSAQAFLARITSPVIGLLAAVAYDVASIYADSLWFFPGKTMLLRCAYFHSSPTGPWDVLVECLLLLVAFSALFVIAYARSDLISIYEGDD